jgi:2-oxoglutarate dehydrogenase E2 component (dihydrolipoamide succinyltransferase)
MAIEIKVPSVGESITEGTIARWLKREGEQVRPEEPLFELETEKATTQVAAPAEGTLHIEIPEGQTVQIGAVIGRLEEGKGGRIEPKAQVPAAAKSPAAPRVPDKRESKADGAVKLVAASTTVGKDTVVSPAARQLVEDGNLDVSRIVGSGRGGLITKEDVVGYLNREKGAKADTRPPAPALEPSRPQGTPPSPKPEAAELRETRQRVSAIRQRIADRLLASQQTTATLTTFNEADMSAIMALRGRFKDQFKEKHGINLGFMPFFVKACVEALRAYPAANAWMEGNEIVYHHYYNIGVAVSSEKGLMVPVLRDADAMSFAQIDRAIAELAAKARDGQIAVTDLQGGTFTISNGGVFGSLVSTPILNPPQSAILGMHAIQKRPVVVDDQIVIRPMMYLALSYDHRIIDGREAVLFLVRVKECVENPERLLLEV